MPAPNSLLQIQLPADACILSYSSFVGGGLLPAVGAGFLMMTSRPQSGQNVGPDLPIHPFINTGVGVPLIVPSLFQKQNSAGYPVFCPLGAMTGILSPADNSCGKALPVAESI